LGLDSNAAQEAFADFISAGNLRADQMTFINNIISYLTTNGTIDKVINLLDRISRNVLPVDDGLVSDAG